MVAGKLNKQLADELGTSKRTLNAHRAPPKSIVDLMKLVGIESSPLRPETIGKGTAFVSQKRPAADGVVPTEGLMNVVNDEVPDVPTEIVGNLLTVRCEYDVALWMPSEIPRRKE